MMQHNSGGLTKYVKKQVVKLLSQQVYKYLISNIVGILTAEKDVGVMNIFKFEINMINYLFQIINQLLFILAIPYD